MEIPAARDAVDAVREAFGDAVLHVKEFRGETTIVVEALRVAEVLDFLARHIGFGIQHALRCQRGRLLPGRLWRIF